MARLITVQANVLFGAVTTLQNCVSIAQSSCCLTCRSRSDPVLGRYGNRHPRCRHLLRHMMRLHYPSRHPCPCCPWFPQSRRPRSPPLCPGRPCQSWLPRPLAGQVMAWQSSHHLYGVELGLADPQSPPSAHHGRWAQHCSVLVPYSYDCQPYTGECSRREERTLTGPEPTQQNHRLLL